MRFLSLAGGPNLGDQVTNVLIYLWPLFPHATEGNYNDAQNGEIAVLSGGGILDETSDAPILRLGRSVVWGAGTNTHGITRPTYPPVLELWEHVGIRDYGTKHRWVPCPSCMSPLFDDPPDPVFDVVTYGHWEKPIGEFVGPYLSNRGTRRDFPRAVRFLASGKTVRTNSYHGAYWALLLGREVELVDPFSNRFLFLPAHYDGNCLTPMSELLQESRNANINFAAEIKKWYANVPASES